MALREQVCRILYEEWDPIGIKGFGVPADDEYDNYADTIVRYIRERRDIYKLTSHLQQVRRNSLGRSAPDDDRDRHVAQLLHALGE